MDIDKLTLDELVVSGTVFGYPVSFEWVKYKINNGTWKNASLNGNEFNFTENVSALIGKNTIKIKAKTTWGDIAEAEKEFEFDAVEKLYRLLFKHRLDEPEENISAHKKLCEDLIDNCSVGLQEYYEGLDAVVNGLEMNKTEVNDFLKKLAIKELDSAEVAGAKILLEEKPGLKSYRDLFTWLLEFEIIKDGEINASDEQIIDSYMLTLDDMDETEKLLADIKHLTSKDNRAARIGNWFHTNFSKKKGIDMSDPLFGRLGIYYPGVFDAFEVDNWIFYYIPKQLEFFEETYGDLERLLKSKAGFPYIIRPFVSLSINMSMSRDEVFIPINESFNGYEHIKNKFKDWNVDDIVPFKQIEDGLDDWQTHVYDLTDRSGPKRRTQIENWSEIYKTISGLESENYDINCAVLYKFAELLRFSGFWVAPNGTIMKNYTDGYRPLATSAVNVPNHMGVFAIYYNQTENKWKLWGDRAVDVINRGLYEHGTGQRFRVDTPVTYVHKFIGENGEVSIKQVDITHNYMLENYNCKAVEVPDKFVDMIPYLKFLSDRLSGALQYWNRSIIRDRYKIA